MTATAASWQHEPFGDGVPLPFAAAYSAAEFARIAEGFVPAQMEDKWFIFHEAPHLFLHRSWTGLPVYRLRLEPREEGVVVVEALWSNALATDDAAAREYEARLLDFLVAVLLLGQRKPFPRPSGVDESAPGVFQHHVAGTGHAEIVVDANAGKPGPIAAAKKPWWRFW